MPGRYADPTYDFVFKRVFGDENHKNVTINFLNVILNRKPGSLIKNIEFSDPVTQKRNDEDGYTIFDVYCIDEKKKQYIVEIQRKSQDHFKERCQDYAARALSRQFQKKRNYKSIHL